MQKFRALGASSPDPRASRGRGFCPQTPFLRRLRGSPTDPQTASQCEFLATPPALSSSVLCANPTHKYPNCLFKHYLHLQQHTSARAAFQLFYISKTKARNQRKVKDDVRLALWSTKPRIPKLALWLHSLPWH